MMRVNKLLLSCLAFVTLAAPAHASLDGWDSKPGDPCTAAEEGHTRRNASASLDGSEITLICDGSQWQSAAGGDSDTLAGLSCSSGQIAKWNGSAWACAADDAGSGADNLGNHTATANLAMGANSVVFSNSTGDKVRWYSNTYGTGIESSTLTHWAATNHRWRIGGTSVSTGTERMLLNNGGLTLSGVLNIPTGSDAKLDSGGFMLLGQETGTNLVLDNNEIMARNNGAESTLHLNADGGGVAIGGQGGTYTLEVSGNSETYLARFRNTNLGVQPDGIIIQTGTANNPSSSSHFIRFRDGDGDDMGSISGNGSGGIQFNTGSDRRIKDNIVDTRLTIDDLMAIRVRDYNPKGSHDKLLSGFIAQELYEAYPKAVNKPESDDALWTVDYMALTPLLVKAVQDLKADNERLRAEFERLKQSIQ